MSSNINDLKWCNRKKHYVAKNMFNKNATNLDGLQYYCRSCKNEYPANKKRQAEYYLENRKKLLAKANEYYINNKDKVKARHRKRLKTDPEYRLKCSIRSRIWKILKQKSTYSTNTLMKLLQCDHKQLVKHLESLFKKGMTWENHGSKWHVDHIKPLSSFDLSLEEDRKIAFHYKNLQPLWALENLKKGAKIEKNI